MTNQSSHASLSEDVTQNLRDEVFTINPRGLTTHPASTDDNYEAMATVASDVRGVCQAADAFYCHARFLGFRFGQEGNTVKKFHEWDAPQSTRRTLLTSLVERFLLRYPCGQPGPEDVLEARYIIGRGNTIKLLRFLDTHLYCAREHNNGEESEYALALVSEEIEGRIEHRKEEEEDE
jgi:hypothetical protein